MGGAGYSGEPHVFVSADTCQKSSFVNSLGAKRKPLRGTTNEPFNQSPTQLFYCSNAQLSAFAPLHLSRVLYKSTPFYAKQTQFTEYSNERKVCYNNGLCQFTPAQPLQKQSQNKPNTNPIQSQSKPIKPNTNPIQTQYKPNTNPGD